MYRFSNVGMLFLGALLLLLVLFQDSYATKTSDMALRELIKNYESIRSFTGTIETTINNKSSKGSIKFKKPNKVAIDFYSPEPRKIISDGKNIWIYLSRENTTIKQPILPKDRGFSIYVSDYENPFSRLFDEYIVTSFSESGNTYVFKMKPKPGVVTGFTEIYIVAYKQGLLQEFSGITIDKSKFSVKYSYSSINPELDDREFFFSPPANSQVFSNIFD